MDGYRCLVWLEALRVIEVGEELTFDYGKLYNWHEDEEREPSWMRRERERRA